jgi:hypothetical protein
MTNAELDALAKGLTITQRRDLTERWGQFVDCDELSGHRGPDEFTADMLLDGFAELRSVEPDDLEDPFAWERGIEPGGMVYVLTPLGLALRDYLRAQEGSAGGEGV